jgi:putative ABC transport system substrate-binding protein
MKRREFIASLGASLAGLAGAHAQQPGKLPVVGFIIPGTEQSHGKLVAAFTAHLAELGWIDGRTVVLAYRWTEGHPERYAEFAAELAQLKADVMLTTVSSATVAIQQAAPTTPIVMPVLVTGSPLIASLSHPGGMVTGLSQMGWELGSKRFELLAKVVPQLRHLAVLGVDADVKRIRETAEVTSAARKADVEVVPLVVRRADDIAPALASVKGRVEALYLIIDPLLSVNQVAINALASEARLPTMSGLRDYVASGGLMSYGVSFEESFRRCADYVDKILRGAKPADMPVEQPSKFELAINLKTAKALGLTIPETVLATADEVIE